MKEYFYKIEGNEYVLYHGDKVVSRNDYAIALCYNLDGEFSGILKYGNKKTVETYFKKNFSKLMNSGLTEMAQNLKFISGRLPVDEVNKAISITGYISKLHQKIINNEIQVEHSVHPDIDELN